MFCAVAFLFSECVYRPIIDSFLRIVSSVTLAGASCSLVFVAELASDVSNTTVAILRHYCKWY